MSGTRPYPTAAVAAALEFQFVVPLGIEDFHPNDYRWFPLMKHRIRGQDQHLAVFIKLKSIFEKDLIGLPLEIPADRQGYGDRQLERTSKWSVSPCRPASLEIASTPLSGFDVYDWVGVKLVGHQMSHGDLDDDHIGAICVALRREMRLQVNKTCSFRVKVSSVTPGGLDLSAIKKVLMLIWLVEPLLFDLCAPHRRYETYCGMITQSSCLQVQRPGWQKNGDAERLRLMPSGTKLPRDSINALDAICKAPDLATLDSLLSSASGLQAFSIGVGLDENKHAFVQFNMHEGTLDHTAAKIWARVCMAIVEKAMSPRHRFSKLLQHIAGQVHTDGVLYNWRDLLVDLEVESSVIHAFQKKRLLFERLRGLHEEWSLPTSEENSPFLPDMADDAFRIASAVPILPHLEVLKSGAL